MYHPYFLSNMSHDKKATDRNNQEIYQYCRDCYIPDQILYPCTRLTLAQFAYEFYKLQARVNRTKKLWHITRIVDNVPTPFTYMYEPDGTLQSGILDAPLQFWAQPKLLHQCMQCLTFSSSKSWYMPVCGQCKKARFCSHDCFKEGWKFHQLFCGNKSKIMLFSLFQSMASAIKESRISRSTWTNSRTMATTCSNGSLHATSSRGISTYCIP